MRNIRASLCVPLYLFFCILVSINAINLLICFSLPFLYIVIPFCLLSLYLLLQVYHEYFINGLKGEGDD